MSKPIETSIQRLRNTQGLAKLIGQSPAFVKAISQISVIANGEASVLISGETGTGKELIARAIHYLSKRSAGPFVPVNCGSLPDTLLEDELFGHERGAFTDAKNYRPGLISQATQGTLFLDEVDSLSSKAQVALLRVLQDKTFRTIGSLREQKVNVRFLAASNTPLTQMVQAGTFRADLYYRLCVFLVDLPPLRKRREDIIVLASHFLEKHCSPGRTIPQITPVARLALESFDWPGNVRELENVMIRALEGCQDDQIGVAELRLTPGFEDDAAGNIPDQPRSGLYSVLKRETINKFEREYLIRLMTEHNGNVTKAARAAGKERRDLGKLLKKHQVDPKLFTCKQ